MKMEYEFVDLRYLFYRLFLILQKLAKLCGFYCENLMYCLIIYKLIVGGETNIRTICFNFLYFHSMNKHTFHIIDCTQMHNH